MLASHQFSSRKPPAAFDPQASAALAGPLKNSGRRCVNDQTEKTPLWIDEMIRVRDSRDRQAFAALFEHFAPRIKGYLIKSGADATTAEECAQDVMTTLWRKADQFDPTRASVATWVFTIARNRRIDMLRRDRRPEPEELTWGPEPEPEQSQVLEIQQESARLVKAIATLPDNQRKLIEQAYFGDMTQAEIANITGLPLGTIKSRIRLALDRLRHAMK
jgi:RNA polymerase sigma-70 factor (ECF subfamily)